MYLKNNACKVQKGFFGGVCFGGVFVKMRGLWGGGGEKRVGNIEN